MATGTIKSVKEIYRNITTITVPSNGNVKIGDKNDSRIFLSVIVEAPATYAIIYYDTDYGYYVNLFNVGSTSKITSGSYTIEVNYYK